jgi:hypothetical protein
MQLESMVSFRCMKNLPLIIFNHETTLAWVLVGCSIASTSPTMNLEPLKKNKKTRGPSNQPISGSITYQGLHNLRNCSSADSSLPQCSPFSSQEVAIHIISILLSASLAFLAYTFAPLIFECGYLFCRVLLMSFALKTGPQNKVSWLEDLLTIGPSHRPDHVLACLIRTHRIQACSRLSIFAGRHSLPIS